jgi:hypothetical protein
MSRTKEQTREKESQARARAFAAARLAIAENISQAEAAKRKGSARGSVQEAMSILQLGTAEEIAAAEHGNKAMSPLARAIRKRTAPEERKAATHKPDTSPAELEAREFEALVWSKLRTALEALNSLPSPADVAAIVKKNSMRVDRVGRTALVAHTWLEDFVNAYTKQ